MSPPCNRVVTNARSGSTAKWTTARFANSSSFGSRERYWAMAWSTSWPVLRVLQLDRGDGQAVDEQREVDRLLRVAGAVVQLPGDGEDVGVVVVQRVGGEGVAGAEVGQLDLHTPVLDALPQHVEHAARVDLGRQALGELPLRGRLVAAVQVDELVPALLLGGADEGQQLAGVDAQLGAVGSARPFSQPCSSISCSTRSSNARSVWAPGLIRPLLGGGHVDLAGDGGGDEGLAPLGEECDLALNAERSAVMPSQLRRAERT